MSSKPIVAPARIQDRFAYLWLAFAAAFFLLNGGRWAVPLAAWLAPLFLLRFVRTQRPFLGLLIAWIVRFAVGAVVVRGIILIPGLGYYVVVLLVTLLTMLPYVADRLLAFRIQGFASTLVFPVAFTTIEYLGSFGPNGTITSIAYTQYGNLPLMQLVSITGIWGITFLLTWFTAVVNWVWERGFAFPKVRGGVLLYAAVLTLVLLGGGARLALLPSSATLARIAGISASQSAVAALKAQLPQNTLSSLFSGKATEADRAAVRSAFTALDDDLLNRSQQEARAGAKIVVWPETSPTGASILQEDEPDMIKRASALAQQEGIYMDMGLAVFLSNPAGGPPIRDEAVLLDPTGKVVWTYEKSHLVPFGEQGLVVRGDGKVPLVDSPYGRLSNVICFDLDFPATIRHVGLSRADILLAPSDDWREVDPLHTQIATFRAIENGFSLVREASKGLSIAVDYEGRVLASSDYFTTDQQVMVAYVPTHGIHTIYAAIGDLFAWLCIVSLVALIVLAISQNPRRRSSATEDAP
jgi:apolipoprotein N-acyltransferase